SETGYYNGYGFAIPISIAKTVMTQLIATGHVERSVIGVSVLPVRQEDAEDVKLPDIKGAVVQGFTADDAPAKRAGLQEGDVIIAIDGQPTRTRVELHKALASTRSGDILMLTVLSRTGNGWQPRVVRLRRQ